MTFPPFFQDSPISNFIFIANSLASMFAGKKRHPVLALFPETFQSSLLSLKASVNRSLPFLSIYRQER